MATTVRMTMNFHPVHNGDRDKHQDIFIPSPITHITIPTLEHLHSLEFLTSRSRNHLRAPAIQASSQDLKRSQQIRMSRVQEANTQKVLIQSFKYSFIGLIVIRCPFVANQKKID
uniref:Uncharacterized protein n=1 Tax=Opuntia streptacantha TaxID=393608 RepID=A0A7C9A7T8_OPUST